jgi:hypothetical protein
MAFRYSPKIVTDGLVLSVDAANKKSYPGSGTVWNDLSGNGSTATLTNGPAYSSNNAGIISFDGINDTAEISSVSAYSQTQAHTYEAFINITAVKSGYLWILNNGGGTGGTSAIYQTNASLGIVFQFFSDGGNAVATMKDGGTNKYVPFGWHHVVWRYNGNQTITFFVDGVEYDSVATATTWAATNSNPRFGAWYNGNFDAQFDLASFKIYNRALTAAEILQNYNALKNRFI